VSTCSWSHTVGIRVSLMLIMVWQPRQPTTAVGIYSTQLNRELRTQVSDTSKSASLLYIIINKHHYITSSDRFPVSVRSAVQSNFTNYWCCQNLSKHALNALTVQASTIELGKLFQIFTVRAEKNAFVSRNEMNDFVICSGCLWC